jgi:hypothetical protein
MERISQFVTEVFHPILSPFFAPINAFLGRHYLPWATLCALGLFVGAMIWVFTLRREYVNLDAPSRHLWHDLRLWTILSMLPHVIVYLYFARW